MKIKVANLGFLKDVYVTLAPLTLLVGNNNTGKTYLSYFVFAVLKSFSEIEISYEDLNAKKQLIITKSFLHKKIAKTIENLCKNIGNFFAAPSQLFKDVQCKIEPDIDQLFLFLQEKAKSGKLETPFADSKERLLILTELQNNKIVWSLAVNKEKIKALSFWTDKIARATLFSMVLKQQISEWIHPVAITSERTGISLFYKELDSTRSALIDMLSEKVLPNNKYQLWEHMDKSISKYAFPIKTNINTVRQAGDYKSYSFLWENKQTYETLFHLWNQLVNGAFCIKPDSIKFLQETGKVEVPLHLASSSSKALLLLELYLKHQAQPRDVLLIDEPELNLHPRAQRTMARLLVHLMKSGVKVLVTTHSEIMIREFNNLIMLHSLKNDKKHEQDLRDNLDYFPSEDLNPQDLVCYITTAKHQLVKAPINKYGLNIASFEDFIDETNKISDKIVDLLEEI